MKATMTDPNTISPLRSFATAPRPVRVLAEPSAGGNYLRDPVTGELTPNPAHAAAPDAAAADAPQTPTTEE